MALTVPVAQNYQSPLIFVPSVWQNDSPREGAGSIACEIDWGTMGGTNNCVSINPQTNTANPQSISQICALKIDNSSCGADVQFVFPDTGDTVSIPAGSPDTITPVFTRGTFFYVIAPSAEVEDITRFQILNVVPPPLSVSAADFEQDTVSFNDIVNDGVTTTQLIPNTVNGSIQALSIFATVADASAGGSYIYNIEDSTGRAIAGFQISVPTGGNFNGLVLNLNDVRLRFVGGVKIVASGGGAGPLGHLSINMYYRTP
jgi:hypothetical protein